MPAARLRAAALLAGADLHAPSLPPSAILCVRWMRVPERIGAPHDLGSRRRFDRALREALDELARGAMRPADGPTGVCDAVLFEDLSELLACLARDWIDGRAAERWWWRGLLRARLTLDLVVKTWIDAGPHAVSAFGRLAAADLAAAFASALDAPQVRSLGAAMSMAYGGPSAADLLTRRLSRERTDEGHGLIEPARIATIADAVIAIAARDAASAAPAPLRRDQRGLVALAAVVRHQPALLWRPEFVEAFSEALDNMEPGADPPARVVAAARSVAPRDREISDTGARMAAASARQRIEESPPPLDGERRTADRGVPAADPGSPIRKDAAVDAPADDRPRVSEARWPSTRTPDAVSPSVSPFIETPLGGIFYLLNVAIAMRLYGDFTMPQRRGLALSPWDLLALVAEHWLCAPLDASTESLLARLAARAPDERPGERAFTRDRLARFVPRLVRRIDARLVRALGESAGAATARRLLCHYARVYVTSVHVDVMFDLELLSIAIRLAGLDRDPGWIPAAGRIVSFHYS